MRNYWIELSVDGRKHKVATGPRGKNGGFDLKIFVKKNGRSVLLYGINGGVDKRDRLQSQIYAPINEEILDITTIDRD